MPQLSQNTAISISFSINLQSLWQLTRQYMIWPTIISLTFISYQSLPCLLYSRHIRIQKPLPNSKFIHLTCYSISPLWYLTSITDAELLIFHQNAYTLSQLSFSWWQHFWKIIWAKTLKPSLIFLYCPYHSWNSIGNSVEFIKNLFRILPLGSSTVTNLAQAYNKEYWLGLFDFLLTSIYLILKYF